jgi:2-dehydrotetronate isomerase
LLPRFAANVSLMFTEVAFLDRFAAAASVGFRAVECQFPYDYSAAEIAVQLNAHDLQQILINAPPGDFAQGERGIAGLPGREAEFDASMVQALAYAKALACPRVHVMAGLVQHGANHATLVKNFQRAAPLAAEHGVSLLIEPINTRDISGYLVNRTEDALALIDEIAAPNVQLQLDLYHRQIMQGDLATALERYLPLAAHVQIAQPPDRGEPDDGEINYRYVFDHIDRLGYAGWVGCEYRPRAGTLAGLAWFANLSVELR